MDRHQEIRKLLDQMTDMATNPRSEPFRDAHRAIREMSDEIRTLTLQASFDPPQRPEIGWVGNTMVVKP